MPGLMVELWPGDGAHVRLVATSYPVKVALADLGALTDQTLDHTGPVIDGEKRAREPATRGKRA
jgi:hypothetical protein